MTRIGKFCLIITASTTTSLFRIVHSAPSNLFQIPFRPSQLQLVPSELTGNENDNLRSIRNISNRYRRCPNSLGHSKYRLNSNYARLRGGSTDPTPPSMSSAPGSSYWQRRPATPSKDNPLFGYSSGVPRPTFRQPQQQQQQEKQEQQEKQVEQNEEVKDAMNEFLSRDDRTAFITRVYTILSGQLLISCLSILAFSRNPNVIIWMMTKGKIVPILSILLSSLSYIIMSLSENARRGPRKWQLLTLFTVGEAIAVGFMASLYSSKDVLNAMMATAVGTVSVTMYTLMNRNSKRDLSQWGAMLSSISAILFVYLCMHVMSLVGILPYGFLPYNESIFCILGASLFSMYLAYHTRLIVSGKYTKYQLNRKDYVFGAMLLYNDIVNIFLYILRLLGDRDD